MERRFHDTADMTDKPEPKSIVLPTDVQKLLGAFRAGGFEAYVVGGCVRDALLGRKPKDWDIATNATPDKILEFFGERAFYENQFGTVGIKTDTEDPTLKLVEVTTFRVDGRYTDRRHPDAVRFAKTIEEDLGRRDFTVNALAFGAAKETADIVDPFGGLQDLQAKTIRAVSDPNERFSEDALRLLRAVRLAAELGFAIEEKTSQALKTNAGLLEMIAKERIGDEFRKLIISDRADDGIELLRVHGLLGHVLPELEEGFGVTQNKHHIYTVWEHNLLALRYACEKKYSLPVRLAALLHDIGKPRVKRGEGPDATFYGHEVIGARMTIRALQRLRFSKDEIEKAALLVRAHMFNYDPDVVTDASVRRLVARVGLENIMELVQLREADRIGSGVPKAVPYKLRHFLFRVEKVLTEPVSRKQMAVNGDVLIAELHMEPGPRMGAILDALFEEVLDDPAKNDRAELLKRTRELNRFSDAELAALRRLAQEKYQAVLREEEEEMKARHHV